MSTDNKLGLLAWKTELISAHTLLVTPTLLLVHELIWVYQGAAL